MARITLAQYAAATDERLDRIEAGLERLIAAQLDADAPARNRKTTTRKAKARKAPATKGAQTRETLSRKEFNRTLTTKARLAGKYEDGTTVYAAVVAEWAWVQEQREAGVTVDDVLAAFFA